MRNLIVGLRNVCAGIMFRCNAQERGARDPQASAKRELYIARLRETTVL